MLSKGANPTNWIIAIALVSTGCLKKEAPSQRSLFQLMSGEQTGVEFSNNVHDEEKFNILTYRNFYNGGGVAIGDINNDSLPDIYFTANQEKNKLYLNKGNFTFEDITEKAGVSGSKKWSTGVTMADVNADGWLDIYVCNSGDVDGQDRENELYINNKDLTFTERALEYNLNNAGYGTHAAFFDYDTDGDLDCYILNNSFKDPGKIELYKKMREIPDEGGDKLMRNEGNVFIDVTLEAGIYSSSIGFGLGVAVSDLNGDHLPDIYISNDFWERDYLYINQGKGKFSEELIDRINYCSVSSMGADIADLNNDGNQEIFTTDMLPGDNYRLKTTIAFDPYHLEDAKYRANYHYQMVQNCLHLNDGNAEFQEIALMSGVSATDWSWGALIFDFENDGWKDIFVSNGIQKDIMSMDFRDFIADNQKKNEMVKNKGRFDLRDFIETIPSEPLKNYAFKNNGTLFFKNLTDSLGLGQKSFSNGSAYGDLDNDGDLDLVLNNINSPASVYRNESNLSSNHYLKVKFIGPPQNPFGIGTYVTINCDGRITTLQNFNARGFESSVEPQLLAGLGKSEVVNELKVVWPDHKMQAIHGLPTNRAITVKYSDATPMNPIVQEESKSLFKEVRLPDYARHRENPYNDFDDEILLTGMLSTQGPRLVTGDVNGDKLDDFILLGASGDADKLFLQRQDGAFQFKPTALSQDAQFESTCGALFDTDGDDDLDLLIGSGGNEPHAGNDHFLLRLYQNDGSGNFHSITKGLPMTVGNFSTIATADFDHDGDIDVFIGARSVPGNYGLRPRSYLFKNDPQGWYDVAYPDLGNVGMVTDATWADVDRDDDQDLIVVGDWMPVVVFKNEDGRLDKASLIPRSSGWWNRIQASDLDGDGDVDFVLGNWGLNTKFKTSGTKPVTMMVNDFDGNGKSEFIISWIPPLDSTSYPFAPKLELTSQLPALRRRILRYENYGHQRVDSLFPPELLNKSILYQIQELRSSILWNEQAGFLLQPLPVEAQVSPVFGIVSDDFDGDGNQEIWLGGNFYELKPQVGRHDASRGVHLEITTGKKVIVVSAQQSGLTCHGQVRDVKLLQSIGTMKQILVARNNDGALLFRPNK